MSNGIKINPTNADKVSFSFKRSKLKFKNNTWNQQYTNITKDAQGISTLNQILSQIQHRNFLCIYQ